MARALTRMALSLAFASPAVAQTVTLYEHIDYAGKSVTISAAVITIDRDWNDKTSSVRVEGGAWELCRHYDYVDCRVFTGEISDLRAIDWNDAISSLRPVPGPGVSSPSGAPEATAETAGTAATAREGATASGSRSAAILAAAAGKPAMVKGYLEYRKDDGLIVEGQRLVTGKSTKFNGLGEATSPATIPLGYQIEASGVRGADGSIVVARLDAKPNGQQMFESDVKEATDQLEATWRAERAMLMAVQGGTKSLGPLHDSGPQVDRARGLVDRLLPPYLPASEVRVYVVDNDEWNAMAMGNYSIYVFSGIMADLDDDELGLVLGHEIAHATHEHTRKQQKRAIWTGLAAISAQVVANEVLESDEATVAGILTGLGAVAFANGYSRDQEDQADRVGMRYAYEGGFDVYKGPGLWKRFADKYGEVGKTQNILFGDHSRSSVRAAALEQEIAFNYPAR
jgi:Zn-dependent protease with chaperone function